MGTPGQAKGKSHLIGSCKDGYLVREPGW
eukprot:COSAG01_NODE_26682_length_706_cov_0.899506_3_plen_28_part_01